MPPGSEPESYDRSVVSTASDKSLRDEDTFEDSAMPSRPVAEREALLGKKAPAGAKKPLSISVEDLPLSHPPPDPMHAGAEALRLFFGAGGIYAAFLYYGSLQEDVFNHEASDGSRFSQVWFLQTLEALANVIVGFFGLKVTGGTPNIPQKFFVVSGASQVAAKAFTSKALSSGLSFPVATLAKSGKMAPVMAGQLIYGGARYSMREYLQVACIIGGTAILSLGKKKGGKSQSSALGVFFIILSLVMDGVTAGVQKRLKADLGKVGVKPKPYDFMFWTNLYMMVVAVCLALVLGESTSGLAYCTHNPEIWSLIVRFSLCSAIGQSFIFYTVAHFDPLVCSTVTTTRKIFSVLLSIFTKGHQLTGQGWAGVLLAISGILSEVQSKFVASRSRHLKSKDSFRRSLASGCKPEEDDTQLGMRHRLRLSVIDEGGEDDGCKGCRDEGVERNKI